MDGKQILLQPKQLHSVLFSCLCITVTCKPSLSQLSQVSLLPLPAPWEIKAGYWRQILKQPLSQRDLIGCMDFSGVKLFFSFFFQSLLILPILFPKENPTLTLTGSTKILTSPLKAHNQPSSQSMDAREDKSINNEKTPTQQPFLKKEIRLIQVFFLIFSNMFSSVIN